MAAPQNVRVEYSVDATVNIGNFQNVRPGYRISADVPDGEHPEITLNRLKQLADKWLEDEVDQIRKDMSE